MKARIYVTLKSGVLDPQGQALESTLHRLGYDNVAGARIGKYVELEVDAASAEQARAQITEMCSRLIANTVMEDFRVELDS